MLSWGNFFLKMTNFQLYVMKMGHPLKDVTYEDATVILLQRHKDRVLKVTGITPVI